MDNRVKPMIHKFKQNGMNIVMDVNSGIVHVVDDMTYDVLDVYTGKNREDVLARLACRGHGRSGRPHREGHALC